MKQTRLSSLDALRGFDMFFITGGATLIAAIAALFPESGVWQEIGNQMEHVSWDGLQHHDTIFPLFLFIAGVSFPFSLTKQRESGRTEGQIIRKILRRGFVLFFLGMVYGGFLQFHFDTFRLWSVLGRIGLAWMMAALIYRSVSDVRKVVAIAAAILLAYWAVTVFIPAPDANGASVFTIEGNIGCWIDRTFFGPHCYRSNYDPEGLFSTVPAITTALLGMLSGRFLMEEREGLTPARKAAILAIAGVVFAIVGGLWGMVLPINKALWSSSFVCAVAGYSLLMLALFYYIIDVCGWQRWAFVFKVVGMNSITVYLLPRFVDFGHMRSQLFGGVISFFPEDFLPVILPAFYFLSVWLVLYLLYHNKIFLKV